MSTWGQFNFQDGASLIQEYLVSFHDFTVLVLALILGFVSVVIFEMSQKSFINKSLLSHHFLEFIWTALPVFILVSIAVPSLTLLFVMEDSADAFLSSKAVGYQWYWHYELWPSFGGEGFDSYMVSLGSAKLALYRLLDSTSYLSVPVGVSTRVLVTSGDVLHSWAIPSLGVKTDACPGRLNEVVVSPLRAGTFYGQCSEICGSNHSFMPVEAKAVSADYAGV